MYLCHGALYVHVANHDDGLIVGTVPFMIVVAQYLWFEIVDYLHQTDGHAPAVLAARIESLKVALKHAHDGGGAQTPLFVYHTTLLLYLVGLEQQSARPVAKDEQTGVKRCHSCGRHIADTIHGLVYTGIGVEVATKLHTQAAAVFYQLIAAEVVRTVECHVLQEMGQAALVFVFLYTAHALGYIEIDPVLGIGVVAHIVSETVVQLTRLHGFIHWHCVRQLCRSRAGNECESPH